MPNFLVVPVVVLIRAVQILDEVYVPTGGGSGTSTRFLTQYIYDVGSASALRDPGLAASNLVGAVLAVLPGQRRSASASTPSRRAISRPTTPRPCAPTRSVRKASSTASASVHGHVLTVGGGWMAR